MNVLRTKAEKPSASAARPADDRPVAPVRAERLTVDPEQAGQRLDNLLLKVLKGVPKSHVYQLIRSGQVRRNGARCAVDDRVAPGDQIRVPPVRRPPPGPRPAPPVEFPVLFEDDSLLVIDKPAGVAVHGGSGVSSGVIEQLRAARPDQRFLELVHRLDRDTSGVLMIAKKRAALLDLQRQLRDRTSFKRYLAVVLGRWPRRTKPLAFPLHRYLTSEGERRVAVRAGGMAAMTRVTGLAHGILRDGRPISLVQCDIETGRTHQIRVHLAHSGFPILGDQKYGNEEVNVLLSNLGNKRMFLHALHLRITHLGRILAFDSKPPAAFDDLMALAGWDAAAAPRGTENGKSP